MVRPKDNLPPGSQPWKRSIENNLDALERNQESLDTFLRSGMNGVNSSLKAVGEQIQDLLTTQQDLAETQATLLTQQTYLASLISRDTTGSTFTVSPLLTDSTYHWVGSTLSLSIKATTGKIRVTTGLGQLTLQNGNIAAGMAYEVVGEDDYSPLTPGVRSVGAWSAGANYGSSIQRTGHVTGITPGRTVTVRARPYYWCSGGSSPSAYFESPRLIVEVVNND